MTDTQLPHPTPDTKVSEYVRALLRSFLAEEQARQERIDELEKSGHRLIGGGQTGRQSDDQATWEITDWRSGEVIESGTGEYDVYSAALRRLDPKDNWIHIENVSDVDYTEDEVDAAGLPASLAEALQDWLGMSSTSDEDVAAFVGWSVEEVARHRESA